MNEIVQVFDMVIQRDKRLSNFFLDGIHLSQQAMPVTREIAQAVFPHLDFNYA